MFPASKCATVAMLVAAAVLGAACGDDSRTFPEPRVYSFGTNDAPGCGGEHSCIISLHFCPSGRVNYLPVGDLVYRGTYAIRGAQVTVEAEGAPGSPLVLTLSEDELSLPRVGGQVDYAAFASNAAACSYAAGLT